MGNHPFSQTANQQISPASRRRSTRIEYVARVLLSGKDASGTPFREYTQTAIVNLHGCKVWTSYRILVGMLVSLECPTSGASGKGVCIKVWDALPEVPGHEIAVQLIKPQNLWGVPNPPADWEVVARTMAQGRLVPRQSAARPAASAVPVAPKPAAAPRLPVAPAVAPVAPPAATPAPSRPAPVAVPAIEQRLADLERRSTQLVESVLDILRGQAEEITRNSLEEFRQQVEALVQDAEVRMHQGLLRAYEESAASLVGLRTGSMEQMALRGKQMVRSAEDSVRTRLITEAAMVDEAVPAKPTRQFPNK